VKPVDLTLEREIQRDVIAFYESVRCLVKPTSGGRKNGTRNAPGMPDLYVLPPICRGLRRNNSWLQDQPFWHETKTPRGVQSDMQAWWQYECEQRGVGYVLGGTEAAIDYARAIGLIAQPAPR
jgi:hypothetical protein